MRRRAPEPHALIGAYAVDALDPEESARFERHLASCPECGDELTGLRETTARLGAAAANVPPDALRQRVLEVSKRTAQLPPVTGWRPRRARGRWAFAAASLVAAAALIIVTVLLTRPGLGPGPGQTAGRRPTPAVAAVLTAPDAKVLDVHLRTTGRATVIMSVREDALVFTAAGLPGLPSARRYELWLIGPRRDRSAGMLPLPSHGVTGPVVATGLRPGDRLGLTVEPAAGSGHPTSAMLLVVAL